MAESPQEPTGETAAVEEDSRSPTTSNDPAEEAKPEGGDSPAAAEETTDAKPAQSTPSSPPRSRSPPPSLSSNKVQALTERPKDSELVPEVLKCNWESFINRFGLDERLYAVEFLVAGDRLAQDVLNEGAKRKAAGHSKDGKERHYTDETRITKIHDSKEWVQRVRIQSSALLDVFTRVTGHAWGPQFYTFIRPFQYLIIFHHKFKEELERLEAEATTSPGVEASQPESKGYYELLHLRAYVKFAEDEIMPDYHARQRDRSALGDDVVAPPPRIRFPDLWYLFKKGDLIFMPDKTMKKFLSEQDKYTRVNMAAGPTHESSMRQKIWRLYHVVVPEQKPYSSFSIEPWRYGLIVFLYYLDYDGRNYSPVIKEFEIAYFEGEKSIRDLDLYPLRFAPGADTMIEEGKATGTQFINCLSKWHMTYTGWSLITDPIGCPIIDDVNYTTRQITPTHIDGEVIVDFNQAFFTNTQFFNDFNNRERLEHIAAIDELSFTIQGQDALYVWDSRERKNLLTMRYEVIFTSDDVDLVDPDDLALPHGSDGAKNVPEGDDLALLPRRVFIYSLKHSLFAPVDVNLMKDIDYREDGFSRLQLPEGHKKMVESAVQSHLRRKRIERILESGNAHLVTQDFIRDKGRGLIIMLHGEPGVGKTATAEAVAQTYRRPLFPISCGNLNGSRAAEAVLGTVFRLANMWDCILLLDEADVLLSARTSTEDLERNSMVSVFLRMLEYYNGILFLTTNRIGKIDPAISSRIHMMLHYRRLGKAEIESIFRTNADRLKEAEQQQAAASGEQPLVVVWSDIEQFVNDHWKSHPKGKGAWNGRQIRNAFIVATALARAEAEQQPADFQPQLRYWHFKQVESLTGEYTHFKQHVLGHDDAEIARLNEERDDDYEGLGPPEVKEDVNQNPMMYREGVPHNPAPWSRIAFMPQQQQQQQAFQSTMVSRPMDAGMVAGGMSNGASVSTFNPAHSRQPSTSPQPPHATPAQWVSYTQNPGLR